jgi:hypothetical protein
MPICKALIQKKYNAGLPLKYSVAFRSRRDGAEAALRFNGMNSL